MTSAVIDAWSGLRAAQQQARGYDDLVGAEPHLPYDRPPLSKELLLGGVAVDPPARSEQSRVDELEAQGHVTDVAEWLDPAGGRITLASSEETTAQAAVIARVPRLLATADGLLGMDVLRTLEHADRLYTRFTNNAEPVAVIGAGSMGVEVAAPTERSVPRW